MSDARRWLSLATAISCGTALALLAARSAGVAGVVHLRTHAAPRAAAHAYVADSGASGVFTFPLRSGIIAAQPDNFLYLPSGANGIAIGPDGDLYVVNATTTLQVFAPGAGGVAPPPLRALTLPNPPGDYGYAYGVAVDAQGFLYVAVSAASQIDVLVYRPGASGTDQPIQTIPVGGLTKGLTVDPEQRLYVASNPRLGQVAVYATPTTHPTLVRTQCADSPVGGLYAGPDGFLALVKYHRVLDNNLVALFRDADVGCPAHAIAKVYPATGYLYYPTNVVTLGTHVFVADPFDSPGLQGIYEFDARRGEQTPEAVVSGFHSYLNVPIDVKVGP
jgi:sugar lactone lactonase YvrE